MKFVQKIKAQIFFSYKNTRPGTAGRNWVIVTGS